MRFKRLLSFVLMAVIIVSSFASITPAINASAAGKETVQRTIAIVYDNSGSMFMGGNKAWCQALYAIEVFASMMNKGDKLMVYPMWPISPENSKDVYNHETSPMIITEDNQKSLIHTLKSDLTNGSDTPIESIDSAHAGLLKEDGEKWLVVLTDGTTFYENGVEYNSYQTKAALEERFSKYIDDTNILYLGIGTYLDMPQISAPDSRYYEAQKASSAEVPSVLTKMCNAIFGRDELPKNHIKNNNIDFDIPLSKLYVFIQGENIGNVKLTRDGKEYKAVQQFKPTYATAGCDSQYEVEETFDVDKTLQGYMAVYTDLAAGTYTYTSTGKASSVAFYYEVDADLQVQLVKENGAVINNAGEVAPGEYTLRYALVDKKGNKLKSDLLGNIDYELSYSINGESFIEKATEEGAIALTLTEETEFTLNYAQVEFLSGYRIRKEGSSRLGFLSIPFKGIKGAAKPISIKFSGGFDEVDADLVGDESSFLATIIYDGKELTGSELNQVQFNAAISSTEMSLDVKQVDAGFEIKVIPKEGLAAVTPDEYKISANALITSDTIADSKSSASTSFKVNEVVDTLSMEIKYKTAVFSIMEIDKAEGFTVNFKYNGKPISKEKFEELEFNATCDGVDLIVTRLPDECAYSVNVDPNGKLEKGSYTIEYEASGVISRSGEELSTSTETGITIQRLPQWLVILIWLIILLIIALLIWLWLRTPVLPKNIVISNLTIKVGGKDVKTIKANVIYSPRSGRKKGDLKIKGTGDLASANWQASLIPAKDSYRYKAEKNKKALVVNGTVKAPAYVSKLTVGAESFSRDNTNKLYRVSKKETDFVLKNSTRIGFSGTKDIAGSPTSYSITGDLKFEKGKK